MCKAWTNWLATVIDCLEALPQLGSKRGRQSQRHCHIVLNTAHLNDLIILSDSCCSGAVYLPWCWREQLSPPERCQSVTRLPSVFSGSWPCCKTENVLWPCGMFVRSPHRWLLVQNRVFTWRAAFFFAGGKNLKDENMFFVRKKHVIQHVWRPTDWGSKSNWLINPFQI